MPEATKRSSAETRRRSRGRQPATTSQSRFMCLMDMPDSAAAVREISRVLVPGGCLCIAVTHPLNGTAEFLGDYFTERAFDERVEAGGLSIRFVGRERPIGHYTRVLADSGFVIESFASHTHRLRRLLARLGSPQRQSARGRS